MFVIFIKGEYFEWIMVIHLTKHLQEALEDIGFSYCHEFPVYDAEVIRTHLISDSVIEQYGNAKWTVVDILNEKYSAILFNRFDLHNWLEKNQDDEVAYFLNEAGSNSLNYSQYLAPSRFHLWLGKKGFVIGIEQKGHGFNAAKIEAERKRENQGGAFSFFRECKNTVFFDNAEDAKVVYFEVKF